MIRLGLFQKFTPEELQGMLSMTHAQRCAVNAGLDEQGGSILGGNGRTSRRSKGAPRIPTLEEQFQLSDASPSGLVYRMGGLKSTATAGCMRAKVWPADADQRSQVMWPPVYTVAVVAGFVPIPGLDDAWEMVLVQHHCSAIRAYLQRLEQIKLLEIHMGLRVPAEDEAPRPRKVPRGQAAKRAREQEPVIRAILNGEEVPDVYPDATPESAEESACAVA